MVGKTLAMIGRIGPEPAAAQKPQQQYILIWPGIITLVITPLYSLTAAMLLCLPLVFEGWLLFSSHYPPPEMHPRE